MEKCLALVMGGGGARGALQVGALRALFESGYRPDLLVGTSIGAVNATALALWGVDLTGVDALERAYHDLADARLMEPPRGRASLRILRGQPNIEATQRVAEFMIAQGITPDLRFSQISGVRLGLVCADLDSGEPFIFGFNPQDSVFEGVLASIALPPFFAPVERDGRLYVDGGALSKLPIEPALSMGATEIIALDLDNPVKKNEKGHSIGRALDQYSYALNCRHIRLEAALAREQGVPVHRIALTVPDAPQIWDFHTYPQLIREGYEITKQKILTWRISQRNTAAIPQSAHLPAVCSGKSVQPLSTRMTNPFRYAPSGNSKATG